MAEVQGAVEKTLLNKTGLLTKNTSVYFPAQLCAHGERRNLFGDWNGGIDVSQCAYCSGKHKEHSCKEVFHLQKRSGRKATHTLVAVAPSVPLVEPNNVCNVEEDPCMGKVKLIHGNLRDTLRSLRVHKSQMKNKKNRKKVHEDLKAIKSMPFPETVLCSTRHFGGVKKLVDGLQLAWGKSEFRLENPQYLGGAMCADSLPGDGNRMMLFYPSGEKLDHISGGLIMEGKNYLSVAQQTQYDLKSRIYQISTSCVNDSLLSLVRTNEKCTLLRIDSDESALHFVPVKHDKRGKAEAQPSFVCCSPYTAGEAVVAHTSGKVYMWHQKGQRIVCCNLEHRFACDASWWRVHYGAHPRLLVVSDHTGVALWDIRNTTKKHSSDLLTLPHSSLHRRERVSVCRQYKHNYHLVATDYTLMLLDERFTNHPVVTWNTMLPGISHYMDVTCDVLGEQPEDLVILASASPAETHCHQLSTAHQSPQSTVRPWKASSIQDLLCSVGNTDVYGERSRLHHRLKTSLAGAACMRWNDGKRTSVLQLTVHGDVFSQTYQLTAAETAAHLDKTWNLGAGSSHLHPNEETQSFYTEWARIAQEPFDEGTRSKNTKRFHSRVIDKEMPVASIHCDLCSSGLNNPDFADKPGDPPQSSSMTCRLCNNQLTFGQKLVKAVQQDQVMPSTQIPNTDLTDINMVLWKLNSQRPQNPTSRLLLALWQKEKDIQPIVQEQVKERKAMAIELREKKRKHQAHDSDYTEQVPVPICMSTPYIGSTPIRNSAQFSSQGFNSPQSCGRQGLLTNVDLTHSQLDEVDCVMSDHKSSPLQNKNRNNHRKPFTSMRKGKTTDADRTLHRGLRNAWLQGFAKTPKRLKKQSTLEKVTQNPFSLPQLSSVEDPSLLSQSNWTVPQTQSQGDTSARRASLGSDFTSQQVRLPGPGGDTLHSSPPLASPSPRQVMLRADSSTVRRKVKSVKSRKRLVMGF